MLFPLVVTMMLGAAPASAALPQELVGAIQSGFKSPLPHQQNRDLRELSTSRLREEYGEQTSTAPAPHSTGIGPIPYVVMGGCNAADLITTKLAFDRGAVEGNPGIGAFGDNRSFKTIAVAKIALVGALAYWMRTAETHGHRTVARVIGFVDGGLTCGVSIHNSTVQR